MKTSKILTAMVLPAMLAACTAEDIVNEGANNMVQSERPLLSEDFRLISEGEGEGVNSRFYMAGSSTLETVWEDGDKYGAALIDVYDPNNKLKPEEWDVIPSLAGNTPFIYDAATKSWKAVAATGVGHYLFSFPYNINDQNRAAVSWEIPAIQELYGEDGKLDLNAAVNKYNKSVSAALLKQNATTHSVEMRNLFSYPKFVVKFDNGLPISTVSQVVLELNTSEGETERLFRIKGGFDHIGVANMFDEKTIAANVGKDKAYEDVKSYFASKQTTDFIIDGDSYDGYTAAELYSYTEQENYQSKYIVAKLPENTKVQLDSDNNKCVEVRFMIPGDVMATGGLYDATNNLNMHIYTNNGVYTITNVYDYIDFKSTTPAETKARVFARNASYTLSLKKDAPSKAANELYIVTDVKDWNELVSKYGASTAYAGANALDIAVVGDNFTLDATAKMPTKADFSVTTDITIDGNVTLQNVFVATGKKVIVKKDATLNIADNTNDINIIDNYGTLNFKKAVASRAAEVVVMINTVDNVNNMPNATLNIEEEAEADFYLYNKYDALTLEFGKVYNNGVLKVNGINDGEIENNGTTIVDGGFTTFWKHTIGVEGEDDYMEHTPAFFNNAAFVADGATYTNHGKFINAATGNVSCAGGAAGVFANEGYAKATKEGTFLITTNAGTIELDEINQAKWSLETMGGTILYVAKSTDTSLDFSSSAVTKLVIGDQNMTITKTNKLNAVEMGKGTLTLPKYDATAKNATTGINNTELNGSLTLKGDAVVASEVAKMVSLNIEEDASLTINKNNKVLTDNVKNLGAVLVAGQFEATTTTSTDAVKNDKGEVVGVFKSTQGSTNNIKFGKTASEKAEEEAEAEAKETFEAAMVTAVKYWLLTETESFNGGYSLADTKYDLTAENEDGDVIAAGMFVDYHAAAISWQYGTKAGNALNTALTAYQEYQSATTIEGAFDAAVETILAEFAAGGIDTDEDGEIKGEEILYVNDLTKLAWAPEVRVYLDDAADVEDGKTAEEKALEALKAAVVAGEMTTADGEALSRVQKVLLNTNTTTETVASVVPAQSIVFAEDAIYKIFGDDAIGLKSSWKDILGEAYAATVGNAPNWKMADVIAWIEAVSAKKTEENLYVEMAKDYLKTNSIITASKTWKYDDVTIQQIVTSYGRLEAANVQNAVDLNAAIAKNQDVKLTADITLTENLNVTGNQTIDLGGKTLTTAGANKRINVSNGNLVLKNGTIKSTADRAIDVRGATQNVSVTIEKDVVIESAGSWGIVVHENSADVTLDVAGTIKSTAANSAAISTNGNARNNLVINIAETAKIESMGTGIYAPYVKELNIEGGEIKAVDSAVEIRAGELNITDGTFTSTADFTKTGNGSGTTITGAAIAVSQHTTQLAVSANISGGEFNGSYALYETDLHGEPTDNISLSVTGGKFTCTKKHGTSFSPIDSDNVEKFISSALLSTNVEAKYLATGKTQTTKNAEGYYEVK